MKKIASRLINLALAFAMVVTPALVPMQVSASARTVTANEVEPNDTMATAQRIYSDYTVSGTISSESDADYYKIIFPIDGYANFWLGNIPDGCDYDLYVYDGSGNEVGKSTGTSGQELISSVRVWKNVTYYIRVISVSNTYDSTSQYSLRAKMLTNGYEYYAQKETGLIVQNMNILFNKGSNVSWKCKLNSYGCAVCSCAMILNNMGKTVYLPDVRMSSISGGYVYKDTTNADPYSVMWICAGKPDISISDSNFIADTTVNPVEVSNVSKSAIASTVGVTAETYSIKSYSDDYKKSTISKLVSMYPQGIGLFFNNGSNTHMIVVTETSYITSSSFVLPSPSYTTNSTYATYEMDEGDDMICTEITDEEIAAGYAAIKSSSAGFSDGEKFVVYDPAGKNGGGTYLSSSWTTGVFTWADLQNITVFR